jgi:hypothetical protein
MFVCFASFHLSHPSQRREGWGTQNLVMLNEGLIVVGTRANLIRARLSGRLGFLARCFAL